MTTRLERWRMTLDRSDREPDVDKLRREIPELFYTPISDREIEALYHDFSESQACAGWLSGPCVREFREWLMTEVDSL